LRARDLEETTMPDVSYARIDEMEAIYDGVARRARAELGVTAWGMQVITLPPNWNGYPNHNHDQSTEEAGQEEVYIPLAGSAVLAADGERFDLQPDAMVRVGAEQHRQILPGDAGIRFVALGGVPGAYTPSPWTQLGGPLPIPAG
jgi:mannose-6-phosphate isomerase-like protein (cupin superfamily)